jgi:6-phosphogluconate dehydrogenase (decarboxylating)
LYGKIGDWNIEQGNLYSKDNNIKLDSANEKITAGSIIIDGKNNEFYIGDKLSYSNGELTIKGNMNVDSGTVGGWTATSNVLYSS